MHVVAALVCDGLREQASAGKVKIRSDGSAALDYPLTPFILDGGRRAMLAMLEPQFAAGALSVFPLQEQAHLYSRRADARQAIDRLPMQVRLTKVIIAHVVGGCGFGGGATRWYSLAWAGFLPFIEAPDIGQYGASCHGQSGMFYLRVFKRVQTILNAALVLIG